MDKHSIAIDVFNKRADQYQQKYMDVSMYRAALDMLCDKLKPEATVLEVACGPGNLTKYLLNKRPDLKITATDMAPAMLELTKANNPQVIVELMDCRNIGNSRKQYDCIVSGFAMPYLDKDEAVAFISDAAKVLLPGGMLYISTMEGDYARSGWQRSSAGDEIYVYYHEANYLVNALLRSGFTLTYLAHQPTSLNGPSSTDDLIIIAIMPAPSI